MANNSQLGENEFFDELKKQGVTVDEEQRKRIREKLNSVLTYEPRVGIFGKTGVGKSSLCNALFGKKICEISDVAACTRNTKEVLLNMDGKGLKLIDVPGVGESSQRDEEYAKLYAQLLPELDLVLWVLKSDDRAYTSDEAFYKNIVKPHINEGKPFFFVLNQCDKIEPFREWNETKHEPGVNQFNNIHKKIEEVSQYFNIAASKIIPVSANEKYNLSKLVDEMVFALPRDKKITLFNQVSEENRSQIAQTHVQKAWYEVVGDVVTSVVDGVVEVVTTIIDKVADWWEEHKPCFITTATCQSLNKPDDCYELNKFRDYRDNWLVVTVEGKEIVEKYYKIAPPIVSSINKLPEKDKIYRAIWDDYLSQCLTFIEAEKFNECRDKYMEMVNNLDMEYIQCKYS